LGPGAKCGGSPHDTPHIKTAPMGRIAGRPWASDTKERAPVPQPPERIAEEQPISFSRLSRYSRWGLRDNNALATHHGDRIAWGTDLLSVPLHDASPHPASTDRSFDIRKARAVLERQ
jgi:hypothetical protein